MKTRMTAWAHRCRVRAGNPTHLGLSIMVNKSLWAMKGLLYQQNPTSQIMVMRTQQQEASGLNSFLNTSDQKLLLLLL